MARTEISEKLKKIRSEREAKRVATKARFAEARRVRDEKKEELKVRGAGIAQSQAAKREADRVAHEEKWAGVRETQAAKREADKQRFAAVRADRDCISRCARVSATRVEYRTCRSGCISV